MKPINVSTNRELTSVIAENDWVLVDFWASWCSPCQMMEPIFENIATRYGQQLKALKANVDRLPDLAAKHSVRSIPTLLLFHKGKVAGQLVGAQNEPAIDHWLNAQMAGN